MKNKRRWCPNGCGLSVYYLGSVGWAKNHPFQCRRCHCTFIKDDLKKEGYTFKKKKRKNMKGGE